MFKSGLMLLSCIPQLHRLSSYLRLANKTITNTLYISIEPNLLSSSSNVLSNSNQDLLRVLPQIYAEANRCAPYLDVRVLHQSHYHKQTSSTSRERCLQFAPQVVFINGSNFSEDIIRKYLVSRFNLNVQKIESIPESENDFQDLTVYPICNTKVYDYVCLGGTFDNLHNGHKVLLSWAQLRCNKCVTIGVTDVNMIKSKKLWELIQPVDVRIAELRKFVNDVDPYIEYNIVPISDPFGPAIVDEKLQSIIVSHETIRGGEKINEIRIKNNMNKLDIIVIDLLNENNKESAYEEEKISSSSLRIRKLGTVIREPKNKSDFAKRPYFIGLTGGIASGKSSIAEKLESLGAGIINCDLMAHQTYQTPQSPAYKEIVDKFGSHILNSDLSIDRRKLGTIVFEDPEKLKLLNSIIWPKVETLINNKINKMKANYEVIVLEIALLLEAKWDHKVDQIWVTLIEEKEAIKRLEHRNNLSEEEAKQRISSQMTNIERVSKANVVFCTYWEHDFTMDQVKKAWNHLQLYLKQTSI